MYVVVRWTEGGDRGGGGGGAHVDEAVGGNDTLIHIKLVRSHGKRCVCWHEEGDLFVQGQRPRLVECIQKHLSGVGLLQQGAGFGLMERNSV